MKSLINDYKLYMGRKNSIINCYH